MGTKQRKEREIWNLTWFGIFFMLTLVAGVVWAQDDDVPVIEPRTFNYVGEISYTSWPIKTCLYVNPDDRPDKIYKVGNVPKNQQCANRIEVYDESGSGEFHRRTPPVTRPEEGDTVALVAVHGVPRREVPAGGRREIQTRVPAPSGDGRAPGTAAAGVRL